MLCSFDTSTEASAPAVLSFSLIFLASYVVFLLSSIMCTSRSAWILIARLSTHVIICIFVHG